MSSTDRLAAAIDAHEKRRPSKGIKRLTVRMSDTNYEVLEAAAESEGLSVNEAMCRAAVFWAKNYC